MERFAALLKRMLILPLPVVLLYVVAVAVLMVLVFGLGLGGRWFAYAAYAVSAYAVAAVCVSAASFIAGGGLDIDLAEDSIAGRLLFDKVFRALATTGASIAIDVLWGAANLVFGVLQASVWAITLGVFYVCLVIMRTFLVLHARRRTGRDETRELRLCRRCGVVIMIMALPVSGIVVLNLSELGTFYYHMYIAIGVATYAFVSLGTAISNFVRYRDGQDALMLAHSNVCLVTAMVSMLTMAILMLNVFSSGAEGPLFNYLMVGGLGAVVTIGVFVVGLRLTRR